MPVIEIRGLTKRFGPILAVDDLSLALEPGRVTAFLGPRVATVLAQVGLAEAGDRRVGGFSLGMRQRLGLAAALVGQPEILILDEPANGLDPEGVHWLRGFLRWFVDRGGTVMVSSHVLSEVAQLADDVVIVARGRLVTHGPLSHLTERAGEVVRARTPQAEELRSLLGTKGLVARLTAPDVMVVESTTSEVVGRAAAEGGIVLYELTSERSNLEDVFLELTAAQGVPQ
ncbi:MAG: ABC transporter ATP-binding protein [Actinobacteria bacterium]|nr:ABC transporter ATP-binding protein [Actinomycetota bacterium]